MFICYTVHAQGGMFDGMFDGMFPGMFGGRGLLHVCTYMRNAKSVDMFSDICADVQVGAHADMCTDMR